jgi:hypothetical protein
MIFGKLKPHNSTSVDQLLVSSLFRHVASDVADKTFDKRPFGQLVRIAAVGLARSSGDLTTGNAALVMAGGTAGLSPDDRLTLFSLIELELAKHKAAALTDLLADIGANKAEAFDGIGQPVGTA